MGARSSVGLISWKEESTRIDIWLKDAEEFKQAQWQSQTKRFEKELIGTIKIFIIIIIIINLL